MNSLNNQRGSYKWNKLVKLNIIISNNIQSKIMIQVKENSQLNADINRKKVERELFECESQSLFQVQSQRTPKTNPLKQTKKKGKKNNQGIWKNQENQKYEKFLSKHIKIISDNIVIRRKKKIHVLMSKSIKTRTPQQCRSHHQKMLKSHQTVLGIIEFLKGQYKIYDKTENVKIESQAEIIIPNVLEQLNQDIYYDFQVKNSPFIQYYSPDSPNLKDINHILWWDGQFI